MANTNLSLIPQNFPVTVNMLVVLKGAEKMETEMKGLRGKVAAFKKSMEDSGLEPLDVAGFIAEGGLLKPFQDGIKKAIEAQDALAKKARALKGLKVPKVVQGETSANLEKFNKALDNISLKIGQALLPAVNGIVTALIPVMTSIGQFVANNPYLVEGLAAAAVAFTVVTVGAMGLVAVLGILTSPIGLIAAAIAAAVAIIVIGARLITNNWASISGFFGRMWDYVSTKFNAGVAATTQAIESMGALISKTWGEISAEFFAGVDSVVNIYNGLVSKAQAGTDKLAALSTSRRVSCGTRRWRKPAALSVISSPAPWRMHKQGSTSSGRSSISHRVRCGTRRWRRPVALSVISSLAPWRIRKRVSTGSGRNSISRRVK